jgi:hypothetical protein
LGFLPTFAALARPPKNAPDYVEPTFPKLDVFCSISSLRCARIKPFWHGLPWFGHLMRDLIALSGLEGRFGPAFGLVDTHLVRPVKPRSFGFG